MTPFTEALEKLVEEWETAFYNNRLPRRQVEPIMKAIRKVAESAAQLGAEHVVRKVEEEGNRDRCEFKKTDLYHIFGMCASCQMDCEADACTEAARQGLSEVKGEKRYEDEMVSLVAPRNGDRVPVQSNHLPLPSMTHQQILDAFDEEFMSKWENDGDCAGGNSYRDIKSFLLTHLKAERKAALQDAYWAARDKTDATEVAGEMLKAIHDLIDKLIGEGEDYPQQKVAVSRTTG